MSPPSQPVFVDFSEAPWVRDVQRENPWPRSWLKARFRDSDSNPIRGRWRRRGLRPSERRGSCVSLRY